MLKASVALLRHQYCNGVDWRQKLDSQRGAVLATELKNNSYKLARWTCCAMLAGSEYLKLGYVCDTPLKTRVQKSCKG